MGYFKYNELEFAEIKEYLYSLASGEDPQFLEDGICFNLTEKFGTSLFSNVWEDWDEFTGSSVYPVPCMGSKAADAYEAASKRGSLWEGKYGDTRRRLCLWLADNIEENWYV